MIVKTTEKIEMQPIASLLETKEIINTFINFAPCTAFCLYFKH